MDIKGIFKQVLPFTSKTQQAKASESARTKTDASGDRDGNGQAAGEERKKRNLTDEEIQKVVKHLESLQGVKDNGLTVRATTANEITVILIEDRTGKTVRRIPESEFEGLMANQQKKSGNLLNRAL